MMTQKEICLRIGKLMEEQNPIASDLFALKIKKKELVLVIIAPKHHDPDTVCLFKGKDLIKGLSNTAWDQVARATILAFDRIERRDKPNGTDPSINTERNSEPDQLHRKDTHDENSALKVGSKSNDDPANAESGSESR